MVALVREWEFLRDEGGYTFARAIGRGADPTDAPLKESWEYAAQTVANLQPVQGATNLVQVICFVIAPLVFFTYGAIAVTRDTQYKMLKFRAVREGPRRLFVSQAIALMLAVVALAAAALVVSVLISAILHFSTSGRIATDGLEVPRDLGVTGPLPSLMVMIGSGLVFAYLGMATAFVVRRPLYVVPTYVVAFFLVPVLGRFDPRNLLMAIAYPHLEFVGGFDPSPPEPFSGGLAALLLAVGVVVILLLAYLSRSRRSQYTT